ncbi:RNA polymerase subunit AC19, variant 2 [Fusarium oxysporum]|nr:RNA polymerase subunit AC19, variant 2 [Fusarium oxysporum]
MPHVAPHLSLTKNFQETILSERDGLISLLVTADPYFQTRAQKESESEKGFPPFTILLLTSDKMPARTKKEEQPQAEDTNMEDAPVSAQPAVNDEAVEDEEEEEETEPQRVRILPGSTDTAASFEFTDEGHTLGNALRYIIMKKFVFLACPTKPI